MKIPHLTRPDRSRFYPLVCKALEQAKGTFPVATSLTKPGGYSGTVVVTLGKPREIEFEADVQLTDWTRFPARIRAAVTALRDDGNTGRFRIAHHNGHLSIDVASTVTLQRP
jgi:hypothetical protein